MIGHIEHHYAESLTLKVIASAAGVSIREFQCNVNERPMNYLSNYWLFVAAQPLTSPDMSIGAIADACGFTSQSYFNKCFHKRYGMRPTDYRKLP